MDGVKQQEVEEADDSSTVEAGQWTERHRKLGAKETMNEAIASNFTTEGARPTHTVERCDGCNTVQQSGCRGSLDIMSFHTMHFSPIIFLFFSLALVIFNMI